QSWAPAAQSVVNAHSRHPRVPVEQVSSTVPEHWVSPMVEHVSAQIAQAAAPPDASQVSPVNEPSVVGGHPVQPAALTLQVSMLSPAQRVSPLLHASTQPMLISMGSGRVSDPEVLSTT